MKISVIGCGLRTPLLLYGLQTSDTAPDEIALFDIDPNQAALMSSLGKAACPEAPSKIRVSASAEDAIDGSDFVISSIRPGGMAGRARDERLALELGYAGQETIGPAGCAMAWRSIPAVLEYVRLMEKRAPKAWFVNFTNPAGLVTQAILDSSDVRAIGICDTPAELFYRIALSFGVGLDDVDCQYFGLNHLGFVSRVEVRGQDRTAELFADDERLKSLYPAPLFPLQLVRHLGLIPTEYVFFFYRPSHALANQVRVGQTRGEELLEMNRRLYEELTNVTSRLGAPAGLRVYEQYLNHRNSSYLQLEGGAESAFSHEIPNWNPFEGVTGYHRIAVQTIEALGGTKPTSVVVNVANRGALAALESRDVVETRCELGGSGVKSVPALAPTAPAMALIQSTKGFERSFVSAALRRDRVGLIWSLTQHPLIRDWDAAVTLVDALMPEQ